MKVLQGVSNAVVIVVHKIYTYTLAKTCLKTPNVAHNHIMIIRVPKGIRYYPTLDPIHVHIEIRVT